MADADPADEGPPPCEACRATGTVLRKQDEELVPVPCPWCEGTGRWIPEHDAQAAGTAARAAGG